VKILIGSGFKVQRLQPMDAEAASLIENGKIFGTRKKL